MSENDKKSIEKVSVTTLHGAKTGLPLVQIEIGKEKLQLRVDEARDLAINLMEASEAAISDAMVIKFFSQKLGLEPELAALSMLEFRQLRKEFDRHRGLPGANNQQD